MSFSPPRIGRDTVRLAVGHLLGGSVLIETVFGWPGLGRLVFDALQQRAMDREALVAKAQAA